MAFIDDLIKAGGYLKTAQMPYEAAGEQIKAIEKAYGQVAPKVEALKKEAAGAAAFTPFSVKTGTGTTTIGPGGELQQTLAAAPEAIQKGLLGQAQAMTGAAPVTAQSLFQQMQQAQAPEIQRQQQQLAQQLQAQGRGGVQTAMYGGTPEQLAMQKAIQEQQSQNLLSAMQLAPTMQGQQLQNIQAALSGAFTPQAQQLATLTPALQASQIAQSAGLGESEALQKIGMTGLETETAAMKQMSDLEAARVNALADALQGMFTAEAGASVDFDKTLTSIKDLISKIAGYLP